MARGASMTTDKHVDPAAPLPQLDEAADGAGDDADAEDVPPGLIRFELEPEAIAEALAAPSLQVRDELCGWGRGNQERGWCMESSKSGQGLLVLADGAEG